MTEYLDVKVRTGYHMRREAVNTDGKHYYLGH
jgi:hypothetical protein